MMNKTTRDVEAGCDNPGDHPWIGVVSDTHGLMRREALDALAGSALILHAGDIGKPSVLEELREMAPVVAIRGNVDRGVWANSLPEHEWVDFQGIIMHMLHDIAGLSIASVATSARVVISGHSHQPSIAERDGILFLNPGSAGPRRFSLPVTIARLWVVEEVINAGLIYLRVS
ncbi:MAG: putative phosphoesterase2C [Chlorobi bacterium]|nr:putative phosphoesterase2C [Chlorobiota bacterium]